MPPEQSRPHRYRSYAFDLRRIAAVSKNSRIKEEYLRLADEYDALADEVTDLERPLLN
jgi:hypothetical protein